LETADDEAVWEHAAAAGYAIVTKDGDYRQHSFHRGAPPKVIWVRLGNCRTADIEAILRARHADILAFAEIGEAALLVLNRTH
jgi:predicted nuclease of predicted toxin-antitoxin system